MTRVFCLTRVAKGEHNDDDDAETKAAVGVREGLEVSRALLPGRGKTKRTDARRFSNGESNLVETTRCDDGGDRGTSRSQRFVLLRPLVDGSSSRGSLLAMVYTSYGLLYYSFPSLFLITKKSLIDSKIRSGGHEAYTHIRPTSVSFVIIKDSFATVCLSCSQSALSYASWRSE